MAQIPTANLEDVETADAAPESGPLGKLIDREIASGAVELEAERQTAIPTQPSPRSREYAAGTTEHGDDHEG